MRRKVYWDACAFLGLINRELDKHPDCLAVWNEASADNPRTVICTSFFTYAEVFKAKCEGKTRPLAKEYDEEIEKLFGQPFMLPALVDEKIGVAARRLMRIHDLCKKPSDAIHLATALSLNVDELHTYDGSDLLGLSGATLRGDGRPLTICKVRPLPPAVVKLVEPAPVPLLEWMEDEAND